MKIFNKEKGARKVYVQMDDIDMLNSINVPIPASIYSKIFTHTVIIDITNRMNFVEFTKSEEIDFFRELDWIVDYKEIRELTEEEIKERIQKVTEEMGKVAHLYNNMSLKERLNNSELYKQHELLAHKIYHLSEILWLKQGHSTIPFPIVPDSDGFTFVGDKGCLYEIRGSLDLNKLLLLRTDEKRLSAADVIPTGFIQTGISIAINERSNEEVLFTDYTTDKSLTLDKKYLVISFKIIDRTKKTKPLEQPIGIKQLVKRFFRKNNQE